MSDIETQLKKLDQRILSLKQKKAAANETLRKRDARLKIELGGLVFTAELNDQLPDLKDKDGEARAIILGVLAAACDQLDNPEYRSAMLNRGRQVFVFKARSKNRARSKG